MKGKIIKNICVLLGLFMIANAICLVVTKNTNTGVLAEFALGIILSGYGLFYNKVQKLCKRKWVLYMKRIFFAALMGVIAFSAFLMTFGSADKVDYNEDVVIVLGGGAIGTKPSKPLESRLGTAVEYLNKNPDAYVVLSGGSESEKSLKKAPMPEAQVMENYLVEKGIDKARIIREEKSTSTHENFVFCKKILDEKFAGDYRAVFITNEFHIFRAQELAENAGFEDINHMEAPTPWYMIVSNCLRENIAVVKFLILGR